MAKPWIHAESSARKFGGRPEEYLPIHDFMDSSKAVFPDNRHRALTHNSWFIFVVEKVFGNNLRVVVAQEDCQFCRATGSLKTSTDTYIPCVRCKGSRLRDKLKDVSVRDICEQHILEDYGNKFIPTPGDYLEHMEYPAWLNNGIKGVPTSHRKIEGKRSTRKVMDFD